jgi:hypothetical protein
MAKAKQNTNTFRNAKEYLRKALEEQPTIIAMFLNHEGHFAVGSFKCGTKVDEIFRHLTQSGTTTGNALRRRQRRKCGPPYVPAPPGFKFADA